MAKQRNKRLTLLAAIDLLAMANDQTLGPEFRLKECRAALKEHIKSEIKTLQRAALKARGGQ
jgi:hypothetical protein